MRAPITSVKHYVQFTQFTTAVGAITPKTVCVGTKLASVTNPDDVIEGSVIKAVYVEFWIMSDDATNSTFQLNVEKSSEQMSAMTFANSILLHEYSNKKNVLYSTQGLVSQVGSVPAPVIRSWIKIPKGKQRFGLGDKLKVNISAITNGLIGCGQVVYKEYQ